MKIPTARNVSGRYFLRYFSLCGEARRANAVRHYMGSGFYPLVLATKKYVMYDRTINAEER